VFRGLVRLFALLAAVVISATGITCADAGHTRIECRVTDAKLGEPVRGARIFVLATATTSIGGVSDSRGDFEIDDIAPGTYHLVVKEAGFADLSKDIEVVDGQVTILAIRLEPKIIGAVTSHSDLSVSRSALAARSDEMTLSKNLLDAISMLPGVQSDVGITPEGGISLRGTDENATSYAFDGNRVTNPITDHGLDPDLAEGAEVDQQRELVNLLFLRPSISPTYSAAVTEGGFGFDATRITGQGSVGGLGVAGALVSRFTDSALNGTTFEDTTDRDYEHQGYSRVSGGYLDLSHEIASTWTANLQYMQNRDFMVPIPAFVDGSLPFGLGPGSFSRGSFSSLSISLSGTVGNSLVTTSYSKGTTSGDSFSVLGYSGANSITSQSNQLHLGGVFTGSIQWLGKHNTTLRFESSHDLDTFTSSYAGATGGPSLSSNGLTTILLSRDGSIGKSSSYVASIGASKSTGNPTRPQASLDATLGAVNFRFNEQVRPSGGLFASSFSDPRSALFDCGHAVIEAYGPNDPAADATQTTYSAEASHRFGPVDVDSTVYSEDFRNVTLSDAAVAVSSEPAGLVPSGYVESLLAAYSSVGNCATPNPSIYIDQDINGADVRYSGIDTAAMFRFGPRVQVKAFVDEQDAILRGNPGRLESPLSPYIVGSQLPGVPWSRFGVTTGWELPNGQATLLLDAIHVSRNNPRNLPAYTLVNLGMERRVSGSILLDIVAGNVTHQYADTLSSTRFAVPVPTAGGRPLFANAHPLPLPDLFVRLRFQDTHQL
jgi:hypothetical protein